MEENQKIDWKNEIIKMAIDKLVFGLVVAIAIFFLNSLIETRKAENGITSKYAQDYLDEFTKVWSSITDIEIKSENFVSDVRFYLVSRKNVHDIYSDHEIANKMHEIIGMREQTAKYIREKESILGADLVLYFLKYVGLQSSMLDAEIQDEKEMHNSRSISNQEFIKITRDKLNKMRFGIEDAKNIALRKYIR
ncbi:hypothetical protein [Geobacter argillaceus]|uniref:Uncharacterized protein n=1 Tax=Geobacter argillaceus TaxID=345631 RepID=A0A562V5M5_9BACT|nr:hypothetical protein [Geobacter argillaceus]TWJ13189.1 hypothetical protein JN12_03966 [Geobacter argillaceus]